MTIDNHTTCRLGRRPAKHAPCKQLGNWGWINLSSDSGRKSATGGGGDKEEEIGISKLAWNRVSVNWNKL